MSDTSLSYKNLITLDPLSNQSDSAQTRRILHMLFNLPDIRAQHPPTDAILRTQRIIQGGYAKALPKIDFSKDGRNVTIGPTSASIEQLGDEAIFEQTNPSAFWTTDIRGQKHYWLCVRAVAPYKDCINPLAGVLTNPQNYHSHLALYKMFMDPKDGEISLNFHDYLVKSNPCHAFKSEDFRVFQDVDPKGQNHIHLGFSEVTRPNKNDTQDNVVNVMTRLAIDKNGTPSTLSCDPASGKINPQLHLSPPSFAKLQQNPALVYGKSGLFSRNEIDGFSLQMRLMILPDHPILKRYDIAPWGHDMQTLLFSSFRDAEDYLSHCPENIINDLIQGHQGKLEQLNRTPKPMEGAIIAFDHNIKDCYDASMVDFNAHHGPGHGGQATRFAIDSKKKKKGYPIYMSDSKYAPAYFIGELNTEILRILDLIPGEVFYGEFAHQMRTLKIPVPGTSKKWVPIRNYSALFLAYDHKKFRIKWAFSDVIQAVHSFERCERGILDLVHAAYCMRVLPLSAETSGYGLPILRAFAGCGDAHVEVIDIDPMALLLDAAKRKQQSSEQVYNVDNVKLPYL